jgi:diguanylate cyclase (GGDEF)-like protein
LTPACELWWPAPLRPEASDAFASAAIAPGIGALVAAALVALALATRLRSVMHLWLAVALGALILDCALTAVTGGRYSAGWYAARTEGLAASAVLLLAFLRAIAALLAHQAQQASVDGLTGLANRRAFDERLVLGASMTVRVGGSLSLLMVDVDYLRSYNECHGHLAGDEALRAIARAIAGSLQRNTDVATRYGGEEFAVILPATGAVGAERVAARIREAVRRIDIEHDGSPHGVMTVSVGVSTLTAHEGRGTRSAASLVTSADRALLRAKDAGRDRVALADMPLPLTLPDGRAIATGSA